MQAPYEFRKAPALSKEELETFRDNHRGPGSPLSTELAKLEVGGEGLVVNRQGKSLYTAVTQYGRRHQKRFVLRKTAPGESTIYRLL